MQDVKEAIFEESLKQVPLLGWNKNMALNAIKKLGYEDGYYEVLFDSNVENILNQYIQRIDSKMDNCVKNQDGFDSLSVSKKVTFCLEKRFEVMQNDKDIIRKNVAYYSAPNNVIKGAKSSWRLADKMWILAGDKSVDFNYYTKRSILSSIYTTSLLYWLSDDSEKLDATFEYINRSIKRSAIIGKLKNLTIKF